MLHQYTEHSSTAPQFTTWGLGKIWHYAWRSKANVCHPILLQFLSVKTIHVVCVCATEWPTIGPLYLFFS